MSVCFRLAYIGRGSSLVGFGQARTVFSRKRHLQRIFVFRELNLTLFIDAPRNRAERCAIARSFSACTDCENLRRRFLRRERLALRMSRWRLRVTMIPQQKVALTVAFFRDLVGKRMRDQVYVPRDLVSGRILRSACLSIVSGRRRRRTPPQSEAKVGAAFFWLELRQKGSTVS